MKLRAWRAGIAATRPCLFQHAAMPAVPACVASWTWRRGRHLRRSCSNRRKSPTWSTATSTIRGPTRTAPRPSTRSLRTSASRPRRCSRHWSSNSSGGRAGGGGAAGADQALAQVRGRRARRFPRGDGRPGEGAAVVGVCHRRHLAARSAPQARHRDRRLGARRGNGCSAARDGGASRSASHRRT